jgi:hypothetical protein
VLADAPESRARWTWLVLSYVLASSFIPATNLLAATPFNVVQSYLFAAGVILVVLLHMHGTRPPRKALTALRPHAT